MSVNNINLDLDGINSSVALELNLLVQTDPLAQALKHKVHTDLALVAGGLRAPSAPSPVQDPIPYPIDPNQSPGPNPEIPKNKDGSVNWGALQDKIRELIAALQANPANINLAGTLFQLMSNIGGVYGSLSPDQQRILTSLLGVITNNGGPGSLGERLIAALVQSYFFESGDKSKTKDFLQQLLNSFNDPNAPPFIKDLHDSALAQMRGLQDWMDAHWINDPTDPSRSGPAMNVLGTLMHVDYMTFLAFSQGQMGSFVADSNIADWLATFRHTQIEELTKTIKDPFALMIALLAMISGEGQDILTGMGGQSNVLNQITKSSNSVASIMNLFKQTNWTPDSAKDFIGKLLFEIRLPGDASSVYPQSVKDQIKSATDYFFNLSDGKGGYNLLALYKDGVTTSDPAKAKADFQAIANVLQGLGPDPAHPEKDISSWTQGISSLTQLTKTVSDQSPAIVQLISAQQKNSDALNSFIKEAQDMFKNTIGSIVQRTGQ